MQENTLITKTKDPDGHQCPQCPSTDGFKYEDSGWGHCFVCGHNQPPEGTKRAAAKSAKVVAIKRPPIELVDNYANLPDRGIQKSTCERYKVWRADGKDYFPSFKDGKHVGTKYRNLEDKRDQKWTGEQGELFGQNIFPPKSAKYITVTEGEYDAMSAYEMLGSRWPVVSVLNGTGSALQDIKNNFEYLNSFEHVVLSFDNDEAGVKAARQVAELPWPIGKLRVLKHERHKDANDYKVAGQRKEYSDEWWAAPRYLPDSLKIGTDLWDEISNRPAHFQVDYPFAGLNRLTYGLRLSEMVVVTAETGIGKTSVLKEIEYSLLTNPEVKAKNYGVGFIHLEEPNYDTALGLMSIHNSKPYHLPDTERTTDELREAFDAVVNSERVVLYDHFGSNSVDAILDKIRHMAALGCKYIVLDHLSIVVSDQSGDERKQLDEIATKAKTLCMELNLALICVIHQNRQGQIRGTAGVEQLANIVIKMYRDNTDLDEWRRNITKLVVEKNRFSGRTGPACWLSYNGATGRLSELNPEEVAIYEEGRTLRDHEQPF